MGGPSPPWSVSASSEVTVATLSRETCAAVAIVRRQSALSRRERFCASPAVVRVEVCQ